MQDVDKILQHDHLFRRPEYQELLERKHLLENNHPRQEVLDQLEYTKTWEYREKNFSRKELVINPSKGCQPMGAMAAAQGFDRCLPMLHGSQGCLAYIRSHLSRHFKEANSGVSSSMTEDGAVFGGMNYLVDGLENALALYKPEMIAVMTTCMAEVIGDDLSAFIAKARENNAVPADYPIPFAHTPSFVGSHCLGYDNMIKGILQYFWEREAALDRAAGDGINIIPGFDPYCVGNNRELKRILSLFGIKATLISDPSDVFDTPTDGTFRMYDGGTTIEEARGAINAKATIAMQSHCSEKTLEFIAHHGQPTHALNYPMGVKATDDFLSLLSELSGLPVPKELRGERGRLIDAIADSHTHLHGKRVAVVGDPDFSLGMVRFLLELGMEPVHVVCTNASHEWERAMTELLASSPFGASGKAWAGKDLWHLRSLIFTEPVDYIIGNTYAKYLERDTKTPLIRFGYPIFDRHHHHRFPVWGYQGALTALVRILDAVLLDLDQNTSDLGVNDYSFDLIR